jgi:hypothetical protein
MTFDTWKTTEPEFYPGPSRKQIADKIEALDHEIEWNIRRLGNLVLSDEDREQTEDLIAELREEVGSLRWCFPNG